MWSCSERQRVRTGLRHQAATFWMIHYAWKNRAVGRTKPQYWRCQQGPNRAALFTGPSFITPPPKGDQCTTEWTYNPFWIMTSQPQSPWQGSQWQKSGCILCLEHEEDLLFHGEYLHWLQLRLDVVRNGSLHKEAPQFDVFCSCSWVCVLFFFGEIDGFIMNWLISNVSLQHSSCFCTFKECQEEKIIRKQAMETGEMEPGKPEPSTGPVKESFTRSRGETGPQAGQESNLLSHSFSPTHTHMYL